MDSMIKDMLKTYINAFDSFSCDNAKVNEEIEKFKNDLTSFAGSARDIVDFMERYESEGYSKRYLDLFGKIAQAQASDITVEELEERQQITPEEFVAQYNYAYEQIKNQKHRVKAQQAYQRIFDLAKQHDNMLDFNIESERGNLLFKLSADDAVEQIVFLMEASDPLDKIAYPGHERRVRDWEKAMSDADITFSSDIVREEVARNTSIETQKMNVIFALALFISEYVSFKNGVLAATKDKNMSKALGGMMHKREEIRYLIDEIMPAFGLNIETVFDDKFYRRLLLAPTSLDVTGRVKQCHHPQNIEAIKEVVIEEVMTDMSVVELVFRPASIPFYFEIGRQGKDIARNYERKAEEINSNLSYYLTV